jgi:hypothetical protein
MLLELDHIQQEMNIAVSFTELLENKQHANLIDWLTVHRTITLVDLQLDTQNSYLFTYNLSVFPVL